MQAGIETTVAPDLFNDDGAEARPGEFRLRPCHAVGNTIRADPHVDREQGVGMIRSSPDRVNGSGNVKAHLGPVHDLSRCRRSGLRVPALRRE
jgi:hypothetical protein